MAPDAVLEISYIGYVTQSVSVKGKSTLNITLREDSQALEEVVVTGFGLSQKKGDADRCRHCRRVGRHQPFGFFHGFGCAGR